MNVFLWIIQLLLAALFILVGAAKVFLFDVLRAGDRTMASVPVELFIFIGIAEILGGLGLIVPMLSDTRSRLTSLAALGLCIIMVLVIGFHIIDGESASNIGGNVIIILLAGAVAIGRRGPRPPKHKSAREAAIDARWRETKVL